VKLNYSVAALAAIALAASSMITVSPVHADEQTFSGSTVDLTDSSSGDGLLGSTIYLPMSGGAVRPRLGVAIASNVLVSFWKVSPLTFLGACFLYSGTTQCDTEIGVSGLAAGATPVKARLTIGSTSTEFTGTIYTVVETDPTMTMEWQDAAGVWIDATGVDLPIMGTTALRCAIVNNSNVEITWTSLTGRATLSPSGSSTVPITGTLQAGASGYYPIYSGNVSGITSGRCSGEGQIAGGGDVGGVVRSRVTPVNGTIALDVTPTAGNTVTITGDGVYPGHAASYDVLLDNVAVTGSPVSTASPTYNFSLSVDIPNSLASGEHMLKVVETNSGRDVAFAAFPFTVAETPSSGSSNSGSTKRLAATGQPIDEGLLFGVSVAALLAMLSGLALVMIARRRA
jgi:hypothetical protein